MKIQRTIKVRTGVKSGGLDNHNLKIQTASIKTKVRTGVKSGGGPDNHNLSIRR